MCGVAGILASRPIQREVMYRNLDAMVARLRHRGPDASGAWIDPGNRLALGLRRLSILDLSPAGAQPMTSASGRYTMVFNGEVYNHTELRGMCLRRRFGFRGQSDTEVILACFETWGIEASLRRFIGMFGMAVWDRELRRLTLVRDRMGIKPLHYYVTDGLMLFGSELGALRVHPDFIERMEPAAIDHYLRYLVVPAPFTIYQNTFKLPPGHLLHVMADGTQGTPQPYWCLAEHVVRGQSELYQGTDEQALDELDDRLADAVRLQLIADVPVGALLSGGIDSSLVVALMQANSTRRVRTFTIGFDVDQWNEAEHALAVARHLGTEHTAIQVSAADLPGLVSELPAALDEPNANPSVLPTLLLCQLARRSVAVVLTGDGGDELFGGYNRYVYGSRLHYHLARVPRPVRLMMASAAAVAGGMALRGFHRFDPSRCRTVLGDESKAAGRLRKGVRLLRAPSDALFYRGLLSNSPEELWLGPAPTSDAFLAAFRDSPAGGLVHRTMHADQLVYLPDDLLAKVDRTSMAVSLEARVPILDHRVVEFSWRLPARMKIRDGTSKWALRQLLYRHVPPQIIERPKMGFSVPLATWLRGPLREWARDNLAGADLHELTGLDPRRLERLWKTFMSGRSDVASFIWALALLAAWQASSSGDRIGMPDRTSCKHSASRSPEASRHFEEGRPRAPALGTH